MSKTESVYFLIDPGTKFLKKRTSDKGLCLFYEVKFDSEINLRDLDNTRIISENIRISKNKLKDFTMDLMFELAGEAGLFMIRIILQVYALNYVILIFLIYLDA